MTSMVTSPCFYRHGAVAVAVACAASLAQAQDLSIHGFGTAGLVHSDNDQADFAANLNQPGGPGRSRSWDFTPDSKAGLQLSTRLDARWSAVLQVTSRKLAGNDFNPRVEWANVQYALTPDLSLRAGRIALSTLMHSDARLVGFAQAPIRVPLETYNIVPPTNSDGIDATWVAPVGAASNTLQASYGRTDVGLAVSVPEGAAVSVAKARKIVNVANALEIGALTLRASYFQSDIHTLGAVFGYRMKALGALYDAGRWFAQGELVRSHSSGLTKTTGAWYGLGGLRIAAVTPYLGYAQIRPLDRLQAGIGTQQRTRSAGVRWDARPGLAVKVQYDRINAPGALATGGSPSYLVNQTTGSFLNGGETNLASVAVDFVF